MTIDKACSWGLPTTLLTCSCPTGTWFSSEHNLKGEQSQKEKPLFCVIPECSASRIEAGALLVWLPPGGDGLESISSGFIIQPKLIKDRCQDDGARLFFSSTAEIGQVAMGTNWNTRSSI